MSLPRSSGVLLHPTSFPGDYGIGSLDASATRWLDWLASAGQKLWQIMPLGHTGYGDSPYQSFSAFAGNPLLVSLEGLCADGFLDRATLVSAPDFPREFVDYGWVYQWKWGVLREAHRTFRSSATPQQRSAFDAWRGENTAWLPDYSLFMALKDRYDGAAWNTWDEALRQREPAAIEQARQELEEAVELYEFVQHAFSRQWEEVRRKAREHGISIIGDLPIFVALDSADVWANPELFYLRPDASPEVVAGVPPDYFSETGQLWGNPLYRWEVMQANGFQWWLERFRATFRLVDVVRVDHFRGFESYWEVPGDALTAQHGRWVKAPGDALLETVRRELGNAEIIAEDLGIITPDVEALRDRHELPGMKVLQFAFDAEEDHPYLPHTYNERAIVYTGTHDNDTTRGWFLSSPPERQERVREYLKLDDDENVTWELLRAAWLSKADVAIAPLQDFLDLGSEARMNTPGTLGGRNWGWRYLDTQLSDDLAARLKALTDEAAR